MINVLPIHEKIALRREYILRLITVCLFLFFVLSLIATILLMPSYVSSQSKVVALEAQVEKFNASHPDISENDLGKIITEINNTLTIIDSGVAPRNVSSNVFDVVLSLRPANVQFLQIFYTENVENKGVVNIRGVAQDRSVLRQLENNLKNDSRIASVDLPVSNFTQRSNIDFSLNIVMK